MYSCYMLILVDRILPHFKWFVSMGDEMYLGGGDNYRPYLRTYFYF